MNYNNKTLKKIKQLFNTENIHNRMIYEETLFQTSIYISKQDYILLKRFMAVDFSFKSHL